jgi:fatty-acid desaturase
MLEALDCQEGLVSTSEAAILAYWKEHREQFRQSETQRSTLTNFLLVITAALSALIVQQKFSVATIPLCVFIILLGLYGALTVAKYYERASYHLSQARALTSTLVSMGSLGTEEELDNRRADHYRKFPHLHRLRLNRLWVALHVGVLLYGIVLLVACLVVSQ